MKLLGSERSIEQTKDLNYNLMVFHKLILNNNNIIATGSQPKKTHTQIQDLDFRLDCENIRFSRETSPAAKSEEKQMFSQANFRYVKR